MSRGRGTNRGRRTQGQQGWNDGACAMNDQLEKVPVPTQHIGLIIGTKGRRLQEIKSETGVQINVKDNEVYLRGTAEQREKAKEIIEDILARTQRTGSSPKSGMTKLDFIPDQFLGHVIGKGRANLRSIETETGVSLRVIKEDGIGSLYMAGSPKSERKATREIKTIINRELKRSRCGQKPIRSVYVDTAQLEENHEFQLSPVEPTDASWEGKAYRLELLEHPLEEETYAGFNNADRLSEEILKVLRKIHGEKDEKGLKVDMWCHLGHAYIRGVDEEEEGETFDLREIKQRLETPEHKSWVPYFVEGVKEMEVKQIESSLSSRAAAEDVRHDFTFLTPSCRGIRVKAWLVQQEAEAEERGAASTVFSRSAPVPVKNVLTRVLSDEQGDTSPTPCFHICSQFDQRMKVDIIMPSKGFDCRLSIRTCTQYAAETQKDEEEDKILESFLMGMKIDGDQLILPPESELQDGFDLFYQRRSLRRTYQYETEGEQFTLTVCKDQAKTIDPCVDWEGNAYTDPKPDIHLHCEEWDRVLNEGDWEPEQIVAKLPLFLQFLRKVQRNVAP